MSSALAIPPSAGETKWTVMSGSMRGTVRLMRADSFNIGRSPECDFVVVNDPKCSRKHADVQWTDQGCQIISLNPSNLVVVNGREVQNAILTDDDMLILGETQVQFNHTTHSLAMTGQRASAPVAHASHAYAVATMAPPPRRAPAPKKKSGPGRLIFYGIIGLVVLVFLLPSSKKKKEEQGLRTEQQIQADIDAANKLQEAAQNAPNRHMDLTVATRQAQENYVRGFRDFRKGQFERSLDSFQACLALDPAHVLCNRYIRVAQRRFNELVQYNIVLGRKYREQNQFQACRSAFRNVMVMVKDPGSAAYKEAKANYDACNALVEGHF